MGGGELFVYFIQMSFSKVLFSGSQGRCCTNNSLLGVALAVALCGDSVQSLQVGIMQQSSNYSCVCYRSVLLDFLGRNYERNTCTGPEAKGCK